jgi:uncharacterized membrane protein
MQKRGRPPAKVPTEQIAVRLPRAWVSQFRKSGRGISGEIQERLARSMFDDDVDPNFRKLVGQIEVLARDVNRTFGVAWHADQKAHRAFVDTIRRLLAAMHEPTAQVSTIKADPTVAGELIFGRFVSVTRDFEDGKSVTTFRPTIRHQLEDK